jgi:hypothetical protein
MRKRELVFTEADVDAYVSLLAEAFPGLRFYPRLRDQERKGAVPPAITLQPDLAHCHGYGTVEFVFDESWVPQWKRSRPFPDQWVKTNIPYPNGYLERDTKTWPARPVQDGRPGKPERIGTSTIVFRCDQRDPAQVALVAKALRLVGRVASTRNQVARLFPSLAVYRIYGRTPWWVGRDARRWLAEAPSRMFEFDTPRGASVSLGVRCDAPATPAAAPARLPRPALAPPKPTRHGRTELPRRHLGQRFESLAFAEDDFEAFAAALAAAIPGARFFPTLRFDDVVGSAPPVLDPRPDLRDCKGHEHIEFILDPAWRPDWQWGELEGKDWVERWWHDPPPFPHGRLWRQTGAKKERPYWVDDPEPIWCHRVSSLGIDFDRRDDGQARLVKKCLQTLAEVASRSGQVGYNYPLFDKSVRLSRPRSWIGEGVRRWLAGNPRHVVYGVASGWAIRCDDVPPPVRKKKAGYT